MGRRKEPAGAAVELWDAADADRAARTLALCPHVARRRVLVHAGVPTARVLAALPRGLTHLDLSDSALDDGAALAARIAGSALEDLDLSHVACTDFGPVLDALGAAPALRSLRLAGLRLYPPPPPPAPPRARPAGPPRRARRAPVAPPRPVRHGRAARRACARALPRVWRHGRGRRRAPGRPAARAAPRAPRPRGPAARPRPRGHAARRHRRRGRRRAAPRPRAVRGDARARGPVRRRGPPARADPRAVPRHVY